MALVSENGVRLAFSLEKKATANMNNWSAICLRDIILQYCTIA